MDDQIYEVLQSYKDAIDLLLTKVDQLEQEKVALSESFTELQKLVVDNLLNPIKEATDNYEREERFADFEDNYGEKFEPYAEPMKKIEGDEDYNLTRDAFDQYEQLEEPKPEMDDYVDEVIKGVDEKITAIKEIFGVAEDEKLEVTSENGKTEISVDDEKVAEVDEAGNVETEEPAAEETAEESVEEESETEDDPEEIEEYERRLREELF